MSKKVEKNCSNCRIYSLTPRPQYCVPSKLDNPCPYWASLEPIIVFGGTPNGNYACICKACSTEFFFNPKAGRTIICTYGNWSIH